MDENDMTDKKVKLKWTEEERKKVMEDFLRLGTGVWEDIGGWGHHVPFDQWPTQSEIQKAINDYDET